MSPVPKSANRRSIQDRPASPTRRRRKDERPGEIIEAATEVFSEFGFAAARLEEVAKRAGVSKATVFVYFPTKEDLFRAVARSILDTHIGRLAAATAPRDAPFEQFVAALLQQAAFASQGRLPALIRLMMTEARAFPDIAQVWYDEVVSRTMALLIEMIERGQARGEVRSGDSRLLAFSIVGPMLGGLLFRQMFSGTTAPLPDMEALARSHAKVVLDGVRPSTAPTPTQPCPPN